MSRNKSQQLVDRILERLEDYAEDLETQVDQRTTALQEEKARCESILRRILPGYDTNYF